MEDNTRVKGLTPDCRKRLGIVGDHRHSISKAPKPKSLIMGEEILHTISSDDLLSPEVFGFVKFEVLVCISLLWEL